MHSDFLLVSACLRAGDAAREEELCFFFLHRTEDTGTMYFDPSGSEASGQIQRCDQNTAAAVIWMEQVNEPEYSAKTKQGHPLPAHPLSS